MRDAESEGLISGIIYDGLSDVYVLPHDAAI